MNAWALLAVYAGTIVVLQVLVYLYYRRRSDQSERGQIGASFPNHDGGQGGQSPGTVGGEADGLDATAANTVTCPHCGATNEADPIYTYCRNCGGELGH